MKNDIAIIIQTTFVEVIVIRLNTIIITTKEKNAPPINIAVGIIYFPPANVKNAPISTNTIQVKYLFLFKNS